MIGQLKERMVLQEQVTITDVGGGQASIWQDLPERAVIWAKLDPKKARENYTFHQLHQEQTHIIMTRYRNDITHKMRLRKGTRIFAILSVFDPQEDRRYLQLNCQERLSL